MATEYQQFTVLDLQHIQYSVQSIQWLFAHLHNSIMLKKNDPKIAMIYTFPGLAYYPGLGQFPYGIILTGISWLSKVYDKLTIVGISSHVLQW